MSVPQPGRQPYTYEEIVEMWEAAIRSGKGLLKPEGWAVYMWEGVMREEVSERGQVSTTSRRVGVSSEAELDRLQRNGAATLAGSRSTRPRTEPFKHVIDPMVQANLSDSALPVAMNDLMGDNIQREVADIYIHIYIYIYICLFSV